jgi:hypothetical protein
MPISNRGSHESEKEAVNLLLISKGSYASHNASPSEALSRIPEDMDKKRYKNIRFDNLLLNNWLVPPPEDLRPEDLIEVPPEVCSNFSSKRSFDALAG